MTEPYSDPYSVLALSHTASAQQIKQAYFAQVRLHPPERDPETFKTIRAAYERLRDPATRIETDMLLLATWPEPSRRRRTSKFDLTLHQADVIMAARALTDLDRTDWQEHYGKIKL